MRQGDRVALPRLSDFIEGVILNVHGSPRSRRRQQVPSGANIWLFGVEFYALRQIPFNYQEKRFGAVFVDDKFWIFHCLVFGSVSAPAAWGRLEAFLGRTTEAVANHALRVQIYVDDPAYSCDGAR
jgi:hypothetical protein